MQILFKKLNFLSMSKPAKTKKLAGSNYPTHFHIISFLIEITDYITIKKDGKMQIEEEPSEKNEKIAVVNNGKLLPLDDFVDQLYSWKPKLQNFTSSAKFKNLYKFVNDEYSSKTVSYMIDSYI